MSNLFCYCKSTNFAAHSIRKMQQMKIKTYFFVEMMLSIIFFLIFGSWLKAHVRYNRDFHYV